MPILPTTTDVVSVGEAAISIPNRTTNRLLVSLGFAHGISAKTPGFSW